jgi:hypothetical protein
VAAGVLAILKWDEDNRKETDQPAVAIDRDQDVPARLPEPRLEEFDDVHAGTPELWPRRAEEGYAGQEKRLKSRGKDPKTGDTYIPIDEAIEQLAGKLPVRGGEPAQTRPPQTYLRQLPSKAASGRAQTGGQE